MLEVEVRGLAYSDRPAMRISDDPQRRQRLIRLPTSDFIVLITRYLGQTTHPLRYMVTSAVDEVTIALVDVTGTDVLHPVAMTAEPVVEKYSAHYAVVSRLYTL